MLIMRLDHRQASVVLRVAGIDLLNHGGTAANGQLVLGKASWQLEGEPAVCFVTSQHIAAGQQVSPHIACSVSFMLGPCQSAAGARGAC
jgi:hypothetical protein